MDAPDDTRKLLVLDLDETLVYSTETPLERTADFRVFDYHVYRRPHLDGFLRSCMERFRMGVWTSSGSRYAGEVVRQIFPTPEALEFVWCAERCTQRFDPEGPCHFTAKHLKKLRRRGYALERVLVVDDTPRKHYQNYGNLIRVREYEGDPDDCELLCLERYLETLLPAPNVRLIEKRMWRRQVGCH
jgi:TFIIF-interacting CTD phosphatase-like protein